MCYLLTVPVVKDKGNTQGGAYVLFQRRCDIYIDHAFTATVMITSPDHIHDWPRPATLTVAYSLTTFHYTTHTHPTLHVFSSLVNLGFGHS